MSTIEEFLQNCVFCLKPTKLQCERCGDFYCSKECQKKDWETHKYICFAMPKLVEVQSDSVEEKNEEEEAVKKDENNNSIAIEFKNESEDSEDDAIHNQQSFLTVVDSCQYKEEDNLKEVSTEELVRKNCEDEEGDEEYETAEDFESMVKDETLITPKQHEGETVGLTNKLEEDKFGLKIAKTRVRNKPGPYEMNDISWYKWIKSENIRVKILSIIQRPNIMSLCENKAIIDEFYEYLQREIDLHVKHFEGTIDYYLPKTNEIIVGKYKGKWYRACVIDPAEYGIIVQFIDYGILHMLKTNEVLPITEDLLFEVCARDFVIDNIPNELDEKQQEILDSREMMITNIYKDKRDIFHCDIFGF